MADRAAKNSEMGGGPHGRRAPKPSIDVIFDPFALIIHRHAGLPLQVDAGAALPTVINTWRCGPTHLAMRLGPDEWLLFDETHRRIDRREAKPRWVERLDADGDAQVVNVTGGWGILRLAGPGIGPVMAQLSALDLRTLEGEPPRIAQVLVGRVPVIVLASSGHLDVLVRSSFLDWLTERFVAAIDDASTSSWIDPEQQWSES
jgi:sarcosine oxidase gamma subunit